MMISRLEKDGSEQSQIEPLRFFVDLPFIHFETNTAKEITATRGLTRQNDLEWTGLVPTQPIEYDFRCCSDTPPMHQNQRSNEDAKPTYDVEFQYPAAVAAKFLALAGSIKDVSA